jgi:NitT/TauT family transport system permease protein
MYRAGMLTRMRRGLAGAAALFALFEVLTRAHLVDPRYLPPASRILATTAGLLVDPSFLPNVVGTLREWAVGMLLATLVAVPVGILLGTSQRAYVASRALVELLRPVPSVALIPLAILLFGRGAQMKTSLVVYASVWPILINTIYGMHDVDPVAKETARGFGLGRLAVVVRVGLPSAAPFIYTGVRVAAAIALIVVISTELLAGGSQGIGTWMLTQSASGTDRELVYAGTIVAGLLGLALNALFLAGDHRWFAWHQRARRDT